MRKAVTTIMMLLIFTVFGIQCTFFENEKNTDNWENPVNLDLDEIVRRGYIRAIVDNSSTSYYIYRGRRMGYEFEMLRNLANTLQVRLHLIVKPDLKGAYELLNSGRADIIAMNLVPTEERFQFSSFSDSNEEMNTGLIQNRSGNSIVRELENRKNYTQPELMNNAQLCSLQQHQQISFFIIESKENKESLTTKVVDKEIEFTNVNMDFELVNPTYDKNLDVDFEIGEKNKVVWALRKNAPELQKEINIWIQKKQASGYFKILFDKYFLNSQNTYYRNNSTFSSISGNKISEFDGLIKTGADDLGWDWRLLASLVYKESRFDTAATSYAGAVGLLQLMPVTLERFGVENPNDPLESLMGGVNYLKYLDKFWRERVPENNERIKFILASYNIGHGHVLDAWNLTLKYGKNIKAWNSVAYYLKLKSDPDFFRDPVVKSGFAKGHLAVSYVEDIMILYDSYRELVNP